MRVNITMLALTLFLASHSVQAEQKKTEAPPSDELLDFLGEWERIDGEWMDPNQMQDISMLERKKLNGETNEK